MKRHSGRIYRMMLSSGRNARLAGEEAPDIGDDVADMVEEWFESPRREQLHSSAERKIRSAWRKHVIKRLRRLID